MYCTSCQANNPPIARYCMACGTVLATVAPASATSSVASEPAYTPAHLVADVLADDRALRGEVKQVTVLFCDVVESTALAASLGAEAMHRLLSDLFRRAMAEVHRYEGTVNQFLGDGFMAIFGAPLAHEDHAARAGLAALAIQAVVAQARAEALLPGWPTLHLRMGLNSGEVVVGAIGDALRLDYTAVGDTTNLAARLQQCAAVDEILLSEATRNSARGAFDTADTRQLQVKGIALPVACSRLRNVREHTTREVRRRGALIGREAELAALHAHVRDARAGHGGVVELEGEPGAGKSRLVLELLAQLPTTTRVALGHCITYGAHRPNVPVIDLVQALLHTEPAQTAPTQTAATQAPSDATREDVAVLGALIGDPTARAALGDLDPATLRGRTTQALANLVRRRAAASALVLLVEDLHWADPSSLDYLMTMAAAAQAAGGLMIVTARPGAARPWPPALQRGVLTLAPLAVEASRRLLAQLPAAAELPANQREWLLVRAEGNPFFLEELVRTLRSGGQVPGDVTAVLAARIDRLAPSDKRYLRIASVLGRQFALDLLDAVAAGGEYALQRVDRLTAMGFIEPAPTPGHYQFVHALTWEVTYRGMLSMERQRHHAATAERLIASAREPDSVCADIARHFLAGDDPARALPYLETATVKAIREHTLEAAHGYVLDAVRLFEAEELAGERLIRCVRYLLAAFPVFHFLHRHTEYAALLERYAPAVEALALPSVSGPFFAQIGHRLWVAGRSREAVPTLERALAWCVESADDVGAAHATMMLGWAHGQLGDCTLGEHYGLRALGYLQHAPVPLLRTFTYVGLTLSAVFRGRFDDAQRYAERARAVGIEAGDDGLAAFGGAFLAYVQYEGADPLAAVATAEAALAVAPTDYFRGWASVYLAAAQCRLGQCDPALSVLERAVTLARDSAHSGYHLCALQLIDGRLCAGDRARARDEAVILRQRALDIGYRYVAAGALAAIGESALGDGDLPAAQRSFVQARAEFLAIAAAHRAAAAAAGLGRTLMAGGDQAAAGAALATAAQEYERIRSPPAVDVRELLNALRVQPAYAEDSA